MGNLVNQLGFGFIAGAVVGVIRIDEFPDSRLSSLNTFLVGFGFRVQALGFGGLVFRGLGFGGLGFCTLASRAHPNEVNLSL